jgi:LuxR family maltose regulon positive regulatory protein
VAHQGVLPPLVKAKLSPPRVVDACVRAATLDLLDRSFALRVTLVCAPAGYGKTTVVLEALRRLGLHSVWYKLDVLDRDPATLVASLVDALAERYNGFGQTIRDRLASPHDAPYPIAQMAAEFVAEATSMVTDDQLLVLDDYHEAADSRGLNVVLDYLIANLPSSWRFVVLSRYEPAFEVGKLRLDGQLAMVGVDDLRFGPDEVAEVVRRRADADLPRDRAAALAELTEGWPASVVLAALAARWVGVESLEDALSDPRLKQDVFSYLAEQVYSRESDEVRAFLRRTSCLEYLSVDLAGRVGAPRRAHRILAHLLANGVFTFATAQEGTFRYHSLFREFLRRKTIQEDGPERFHTLQLATAAALEVHGDAEAAVELYLAANEPHLALEVISRTGAMDLDAFSSDTLEAWLDRLPGEIRLLEPWARLIAAEVDMRASRFDDALDNIDHAVDLVVATNDSRSLYRALSAKERTLFWKGDTAGAADACRKALEAATDVEQRVHTLISLGAVLNADCKWPEATQALESARKLADGSLPAEQARLAAYTVFIANNTGRYRDAMSAARLAEDAVFAYGSPSLRMAFLNLSGANHLAMAEWQEAREKLDGARELGRSYGFSYVEALVDDADAQLYSCTGHARRSATFRELAIGAPSITEDPYCLSMAICHGGTAARRSGDRVQAIEFHTLAVKTCEGTSARNAYLNASANLAYARGTDDEGRSAELIDIAREARELDLLFIALKAEFFHAVLRYHAGERLEAIGELLHCVPQQLALGHLNFLAQELVLEPRLTLDLIAAMDDEPSASSLVDVLARHWRSLGVLIACLDLGPGSGVAAVHAAAQHRTQAEIASVLAKAAKSRHPEVRRAAARQRRGHRARGDAATRGGLDLTKRETQILAMIADGATNQDISSRLVLSPATVKTHVNHIFAKLGVRDRLQAALAYHRAMQGRQADEVDEDRA